jgi:hypothetical protein
MRMARLTGTVVLALGLASCSWDTSRAPSSAEAAAVQQGLRSLAAAVARDVTQEGPLACELAVVAAPWREVLTDSTGPSPLSNSAPQ